MGTRVKVFTDLLNLGHEKVTKTLWQVCNGNVRWQRGSLCFAEQFVRHRKKLLSGGADVCLAAVVKLPGVPYASLHRGPLLDEDFPVDSQASDLQRRSACLLRRASLTSSVNHGAERRWLTRRVTRGVWRSMTARRPAL